MNVETLIARTTEAARTRVAAKAAGQTPVLAVEVKAGQEVTEVETPEGPWYRVVKVNRKSLVLALDNDDPEAGTLRLPVHEGHVVLARDAR